MRGTALALVVGLSVVLGTAAAADAKSRGARTTIYNVTKAQGSVKITFRGDEAAGCRARGVCSLSGTTTYSFGGRPSYGDVFWVRERKRTVVFYGFFETRGETVSDVTSAGNPERCVDRVSYDSETMTFEPRSRRIRFDWREPTLDDEDRFVTDAGPDPFDTRCAGPHLVDLEPSRAIPFADVPYRVFRSPRSSFTTTGTRPFAGGGFAGTVDWDMSYSFRFQPRRGGGGWTAVPIG